MKPLINGIVGVFAIGFLIYKVSGGFGDSEGFDVSSVTCDNASLIRQSQGLIAKSTSPLLGKVTILKASNFRRNQFYNARQPELEQYGSMSQAQASREMFADRKHQCRADLITDRGEMNMYYGWKVIGNDTYIEAQAMPVLN